MHHELLAEVGVGQRVAAQDVVQVELCVLEHLVEAVAVEGGRVLNDGQAAGEQHSLQQTRQGAGGRRNSLGISSLSTKIHIAISSVLTTRILMKQACLHSLVP